MNTELYLERLALLTDDDGDGWHEVGGERDDADPDTSPDGVETCDGRDNDCDHDVDEDADDARYSDADGDGYGEGGGALSCEGEVTNDEDCDDGDDDVHPGAEENCDGVDQDCDGQVDNDSTDGAYPDVDGDRFGGMGAATRTRYGPVRGTVSMDSVGGWIAQGASANVRLGNALVAAVDGSGDGLDDLPSIASNVSHNGFEFGAEQATAGAVAVFVTGW